MLTINFLALNLLIMLINNYSLIILTSNFFVHNHNCSLRPSHTIIRNIVLLGDRTNTFQNILEFRKQF